VKAEATRGGRATGEHRWVAAALVDLGTSRRGSRAEHAARTGRHVLPAGTRLQVLEVYCGWCRVAYDSHAGTLPCTGVQVSGARPLREPAVRRAG
jgi:hypothetical protein